MPTGFSALLAGATAPHAQAAGHSAHEWPSYGLDTNEDR
ncbi:MAG: hypothetical protein JWM63_5539, partial [Gammaproteobacteria bacterium]|nr:hypothetical protein [Gammaproteobacteria bacterium]